MPMARQDDLDFHILSAGNRRIEIINLKPQKDAVPVRLSLRVAYAAVVMLHVPAMELQDEPAVARHKPLVFRAAVRALAAQQPLIPAAARLNVVDTNQRLWTHTISDRPKAPPLALEMQERGWAAAHAALLESRFGRRMAWNQPRVDNGQFESEL